jgi:hypothetical protein
MVQVAAAEPVALVEQDRQIALREPQLPVRGVGVAEVRQQVVLVVLVAVALVVILEQQALLTLVAAVAA